MYICFEHLTHSSERGRSSIALNSYVCGTVKRILLSKMVASCCVSSEFKNCFTVNATNVLYHMWINWINTTYFPFNSTCVGMSPSSGVYVDMIKRQISLLKYVPDRTIWIRAFSVRLVNVQMLWYRSTNTPDLGNMPKRVVFMYYTYCSVFISCVIQYFTCVDGFFL
jgi:hypothetical protein